MMIDNVVDLSLCSGLSICTQKCMHELDLDIHKHLDGAAFRYLYESVAPLFNPAHSLSLSPKKKKSPCLRGHFEKPFALHYESIPSRSLKPKHGTFVPAAVNLSADKQFRAAEQTRMRAGTV